MHVYTHLNRKEMCNSTLLEGLNEARRQTQVSKSEFVFLGGSRGLNFSFVVLICVSDIQRVFFMEEERDGVRERRRRKGRRGLLREGKGRIIIIIIIIFFFFFCYYYFSCWWAL